jgi:TorA maturation chaperone TorD
MIVDHDATATLDNGSASLRSDVYALLAALLAGPPGADRLLQLGDLDYLPDIPALLGLAMGELKAAARQIEPAAAEREYNDLFWGFGREGIRPYASGYEEGVLMGTALARLRWDLAALKLRRRETCEPEDHAAALCESMLLIIADPQVGAQKEAAFFRLHLAPWMPALFRDLQTAPSAVFYRVVGRLGEVFMELEKDLVTGLPKEE